MQLKQGAEKEYRQRHSPIWKDLEDVLRTHGVHNYSIALHSETGQLFAYFARHSALQPLAIIP